MVQFHRYPEGTRVTIRRGSLPIDPQILDRRGTIVRHDLGLPGRYFVQLDREPTLRRFSEDELAPAVEGPLAEQEAQAKGNPSQA